MAFAYFILCFPLLCLNEEFLHLKWNITYYAPPPGQGALSDDARLNRSQADRLSDVCLSVAYIGPKSKTEA